jgi:hypothetical protein
MIQIRLFSRFIPHATSSPLLTTQQHIHLQTLVLRAEFPTAPHCPSQQTHNCPLPKSVTRVHQFICPSVKTPFQGQLTSAAPVEKFGYVDFVAAVQDAQCSESTESVTN